jgi:hypothetical protein
MNSAPSDDAGHGSTPRAMSASRLDGSRISVSRVVVCSTPPTLSWTKEAAIAAAVSERLRGTARVRAAAGCRRRSLAAKAAGVGF